MTYLSTLTGVMALLNRDHESHDPAHASFARRPFATCPLIQLAGLDKIKREESGTRLWNRRGMTMGRYDLNALIAAQLEFGDEGLLLCVHLGQARGRAC